jgi:hypothetical protein
VYRLEQTIDAHRRMAAGAATGKLVVLPRTETSAGRIAGTRPGDRRAGRQRRLLGEDDL